VKENMVTSGRNACKAAKCVVIFWGVALYVFAEGFSKGLGLGNNPTLGHGVIHGVQHVYEKIDEFEKSIKW